MPILALCFLATAEGKTLRFLTKGLAALALERFQLNPEISFLSIDPRDAAQFNTLSHCRLFAEHPKNGQSQDSQHNETRESDNCYTGFRTCRYRGEGVCRCVGGRHYRVSARVSGMPKRNKNA